MLLNKKAVRTLSHSPPQYVNKLAIKQQLRHEKAV